MHPSRVRWGGSSFWVQAGILCNSRGQWRSDTRRQENAVARDGVWPNLGIRFQEGPDPSNGTGWWNDPSDAMVGPPVRRRWRRDSRPETACRSAPACGDRRRGTPQGIKRARQENCHFDQGPVRKHRKRRNGVRSCNLDSKRVARLRLFHRHLLQAEFMEHGMRRHVFLKRDPQP